MPVDTVEGLRTSISTHPPSIAESFLMQSKCQRAVKTGQWWTVQNQPRVR
jgi:hypothetical protein